ncbi:MAG TPA: DUF5818 domain-containing protein [Candidatus Xenobia bacterium]|nr:DUF5818 domain-containing protein [Candidatus Xenobia bacterium]
MHKRLGIFFVVLLVAAGLALAAPEKAKETSYSGWVTDTHCNAKGAKEGHADCATKCVKDMGAKYALITPSDGKVYVLDPQDKAAEHAGHHVKVTGTMDGNTLKVAKIEMTGEQKGITPKETKKEEKKKP